MKVIRFIAICLISVCLGIPTSAQSTSAAAPSEYLIKAGFTYNFAKLMQWPDRAFAQPDSPIVIGILGTDPFGNTLRDVLAGKNANGRSFVIKRLKFSAELKDCNILFVSASETAHVDEILRAVRGLPILTIGETPSFARRGVIINVVIEEVKIRFEVNVEANFVFLDNKINNAATPRKTRRLSNREDWEASDGTQDFVHMRGFRSAHEQDIAVFQFRAEFQAFYDETSSIRVLPGQHITEGVSKRIGAENSNDDG